MRCVQRGQRNFRCGRLLRSAAVHVCAAVLLGTLPAAADEALDAARARWRAAAFDAGYEYGYRKNCDCYRDEPPETLVTVRDGRVQDVRHRHAGSETDVRTDERNFDAYWTIDGLFDVVASALERGSVVRVSYDEALGYPTKIFIDHDREYIGDELDLELTRVTALPVQPR